MKILDRFEEKAIEDIETDRNINADSYESVSRYKLIRNIRKAINTSFLKNNSGQPAIQQKYYPLEDLFKTGQVLDIKSIAHQ